MKVFLMITTVLVATLSSIPGSAAWMAATQTISADDGWQTLPAVAYNPTHDEFLVVWRAGDWGSLRISGIRVDSQGFPIGSSFFISDGSLNQHAEDLAYDPVEDRYLVIWTEDYTVTDHDIYARFIPWDGPSDSLSSFPVINTTADQYSPSLTYNPVDEQFLVVWAERPEGNQTSGSVSGLLFETDGEASTGILPFASSGQENIWEPKVAWNDPFEQYLVVYAKGYQTAAIRVNSSGVTIGSEIAIGAGRYPGVASCRGNYLVTWAADYDQPILDRMVSPDGLIGIVHNLSGATDHNYSPATIDCDDATAEYLVTWSRLFYDAPNFSNGIIGALVNLDGSLRESFIEYMTIDTFYYDRPNLAFGDHSKALVVWQSERPPDGGVYDIRGRLTGGRIFADNFESGNGAYWNP